MTIIISIKYIHDMQWSEFSILFFFLGGGQFHVLIVVK